MSALVALVWTAILLPTAAAQNLMNGGKMFPNQSAIEAPLRVNSYVQSGPPTNPGTSSRPTGWPGAPVEGVGQQRMVNGPPSAGGASGPAGAAGNFTGDGRAMQFDLVDLGGARVVARVGTEVILDSEVSSYVDDFMQLNADRIPPKQVEPLREKLTRDRLNHLIEIKLALLDAKRKVPPEAYPNVVESISADFEKNELKKRLKRMNLGTRGDLDAKMREQGTTLEHEKEAYIEQQLAFTWIFQQTKTKHEATHEDMLAYYLENLDVYSFPAKARWEELRVRVANFPHRGAAYHALAQMGDAVLRGANFADVARKSSQGPTADAGGQYDWTSQGSMSSDLLDRAIFSLPPGKMSPILDDGKSPTMSIVRVIERTEAGRQPFSDVQAEIKEKLAGSHAEKDKAKLSAYMAKLRAETPVWTVYDHLPGGVLGVVTPTSGETSTPSTSLRPTGPGSVQGAGDNPYLR